jgi:hypothetical protein
MGNDNDLRSAEAPAERRGIDRRSLIKGAAVVTAVGWTAPIIVDSLTSPAAAISGCAQLRINGNCAATCEDTKCTGVEPCGCTHDTTCVNLPGTECAGDIGSVTYSINTAACPNCTFTAAEAHTDGGVCVFPAACPTGACPPGTTSVTFPALSQVPNPDHYDQTILNITCV